MRRIAAITKNEQFSEAIKLAGSSLATHPRTTNPAPSGATQQNDDVERAAELTRRRTSDLLSKLDGPDAEIAVITAPTLEALSTRLATEPPGGVDLLVVDDSGHTGELETGHTLDSRIRTLKAKVPQQMTWTNGPQGVLRLVAPQHLSAARSGALEHDVIERPTDPLVLTTQVKLTLADALQFGHRTPDSERPATLKLATAIAALMDRRHPNGWDLRYYTGSVVSSLINDLESIVESRGRTAYRGSNEHALAVGALARWQLDRIPSVIVITSGMLDELKGALANLVAARAPVLIVCAEGRASTWRGFQSTISSEEDMRDVLAARKIRHLYLQDASSLEQDLAHAAGLHDPSRGPYVLLATQEVLEAPSRDDDPSMQFGPCPSSASIEAATGRDPVDATELSATFNDPQRDRILIVCGQLEPRARDLVHRIAHASGATIADSLLHPGAVTPHDKGASDHTYLGPLGLYGYSGAVHSYLHRNGRPRPKTSTTLVFVGSPIGEVDTPFSEGALKRKFHIAQLVEDELDVAPFADISLVGDCTDALAAVLSGLDVPRCVIDARQTNAFQALAAPPALTQLIDTVPMTADRFTHLLGATLRQRIDDAGFQYTGVYDVGRGGISALRNIPRTGPGFSGWFGRAAMGDAKAAIPSIALSEDRNVLAFIGDGADRIGPDIVPAFAEHLRHTGRPPGGSITVFVLNNGSHSVIASYREARIGQPGGRQMVVENFASPEHDHSVGPLRIRRRTMLHYDPAIVEEAIGARGVITFIDVTLRHSDFGDGMSLLDALSWQYGELNDLALNIASQRGAHA